MKRRGAELSNVVWFHETGMHFSCYAVMSEHMFNGFYVGIKRPRSRQGPPETFSMAKRKLFVNF